MRLSLVTLVLVSLGLSSAARGVSGDISWSETFSDDPLVNGRFVVPPGQNPARFTFDAPGHFVTVHYDTVFPTAWYERPIDSLNGRSMTRCDDFQFEVTFRIRSAGFYADPNQFAQIAWGLLNSTSTGADRAGGSAGPYAFDVVSFDYFPNVTAFGGPTLAGTVIHSDAGQGFFNAFDFPFGAESQIDTIFGDETIALDTTYTAKVEYDASLQTAVLTIRQGSTFLNINADGGGGPGGPDMDPATIQTILFLPEPFTVDRFALMAWQDTFNTASSSVRAEVDILGITFFAPVMLRGDLNHDGVVNGLDIAPFVQTLLAASPDPCAVARSDFDNDSAATPGDIGGFTAALLGT